MTRSDVITPSVFVLEDEALVRHLLEEELTEAGFAVTVAATGEEAMDLLNAKGADYSAWITDIDLSGKLLGWDVARRAREINDKLPVIYISGGNAHHWAAEGVPNSQLIAKPFTGAQVITAVSQIIKAATTSL